MKFRVFMNKSLDGPFAVAELCKLPGFSLKTPVCPDGENEWEPAEQYPIITNQIQQCLSGDYNPAPLEMSETVMQSEMIQEAAAPEPVKAANPDWRQAVINREIPEMKLFSAHSMGYQKAQRTAAEPSAKTSVFNRLTKALGQGRKGIFIVLLGISAGVYYPQTENITSLILGIQNDEALIMTMGARFRQGGSPRARDWFKNKIGKKNVVKAPESVENPSNPSIEEIGSEDMGNGYTSKTIVITELRNGVRMQRTTTVMISNHAHKTKKAKSKKSGSAQSSLKVSPTIA